MDDKGKQYGGRPVKQTPPGKLIALGSLSLLYDEMSNSIVFQNYNSQPLSISFEGSVSFKFGGDVEFVSDGEYNVITNGGMITLDSVDSSIHLNSAMAKRLRGSKLPTDIMEVEANRRKQLAEEHQSKGCSEANLISKLQALLDNVNTRLIELESKGLPEDIKPELQIQYKELNKGDINE